MNPAERNLARFLIQLRQASFVNHNTSSEESSSDDYHEFSNDYDQDHFASLLHGGIYLENWKKELKEGYLDASILDTIVLDYLLKSGIKDAAIKFLDESGLSSDKKLENKVNNLREEISTLLTEGFVDQTIQRINQIDKAILIENKELWFEILSYKLNNNLDELNSFAKHDFIKILEACESEQERKKLITLFEDLMSILIVDGNSIFQLDNTIKEIGNRILEHYDINPNTTIDDILKLTYSTQDKLKMSGDIPKLIQKKFTDNVNLISD